MGRLLNEPVQLGMVIRQGVMLLVLFGVALTDAQIAGIIAFVDVVLTYLTRALVTPNQLAEARVAEGGSPTTPRQE